MSDEEEKATSPPQTPNETPAPVPAAPDSDYWQRQAEDAQRELALRRALQPIDWFDPEDAYRELAPHAARDSEGNWRVRLPPRDGANQSAPSALLSPQDAARELAARKPHWVKARVLGGTGAGSHGNAAATTAGVTYAELLQPHNQDKLREYIHDRPEELERLRQAHFKRQF